MTRPSTFWVLFLAFALRAETFPGKIVDPSGAAIAGARVAAVNRVGVIAQTVSDAAGAFQIPVPDSTGTNLRVTAPGFETKTVPLAQAAVITLAIAPQNDSITVAGSAMDVPLSQQGSSASV